MSYSYQIVQPPTISLDISRSPLLSNILPPDLRDLSSRGISSPRLPGLPLASPTLAPSANLPERLRLLARYQQQCIGLRVPPPSSSLRNKPLPSLPPSVIPPRQIISVLELLEEMDNDVLKEVQRVKEGISEAHVLVKEYAQAEQARAEEWKKRRARDKRETMGVDDEFWLNA